MSSINLGQMYFRIKIDTREYISRLQEAEARNRQTWKNISRDTNQGSGAAQASIEDLTVAVAAGTVAGNAFTSAFSKLKNGLEKIVGTAHDSARSYQEMVFGLQALVKAELSRNNAVSQSNNALLNQAQITQKLATEWENAQGPAKELMGWVDRLAVTTPFKQEDIVNVIRTAEMYGFVSQKYNTILEAQKNGIITTQRLTKATMDYVAANNLGGETLKRMIFAIGQIKARGFLAGEEVRQLANVLPVTAAVAEHLGITQAEFEDLRVKGLIPAQEAIAGLVEFMENQFTGAGEKMRGTIRGIESVFENLSRIVLREGFLGAWDSKIKPVMDDILNRLSDEETLNGLKKSMQNTGETIGGYLVPVLKSLSAVIEATINHFNAIIQTVITFGTVISTRIFLGNAIKGFLSLKQSVSGTITAIKSLTNTFIIERNEIINVNAQMAALGEETLSVGAATRASLINTIKSIPFSVLLNGLSLVAGALVLLKMKYDEHQRKIKEMAADIIDLSDSYQMWLDLMEGQEYDVDKVTEAMFKQAKAAEMSSEDLLKYADIIEKWKNAQKIQVSSSNISGYDATIYNKLADSIRKQNIELAIQDENFRKLAVASGVLSSSLSGLIDLYFEYNDVTGESAGFLLDIVRNNGIMTSSEHFLVMQMRQRILAEQEKKNAINNTTAAQKDQNSATEDYLNIVNKLHNEFVKAETLKDVVGVSKVDTLEAKIKSVKNTISSLVDAGMADKAKNFTEILEKLNKALDAAKIEEYTNAIDEYIKIQQEKYKAGLISQEEYQKGLLEKYNSTLDKLYTEGLQKTALAADLTNKILVGSRAEQLQIEKESLNKYHDSIVNEYSKIIRDGIQKYAETNLNIETEYAKRKLSINSTLETALNKLTVEFEKKRADYEAKIQNAKSKNEAAYLKNQLNRLITNYKNQRKLLISQANYDLSTTNKWYNIQRENQITQLNDLLNNSKKFYNNLLKTTKISTTAQAKMVISSYLRQTAAATGSAAAIAKAQQLIKEARLGVDLGATTIAEAVANARHQAASIIEASIGSIQQKTEDEINNIYNDFQNLNSGTTSLTDGLDQLNDSFNNVSTSGGDTKVTIDSLNKELSKTNEWIQWQVDHGLMTSQEAIQNRISALQSFIEQAFKAGFLEEAAKGAENLAVLKKQLEEMQSPVENAKDALDEMQKSVESAFSAVSDISGFTFNETLFGKGMEEIRKAQPMLLDLVNWYAELNDLIQENAPKAVVSADTLDKIMSPVKAIVDGIAYLGSYENADIFGALENITPNLKLFVNWLSNLYDKLLEKIPKASAISDKLDTIFSPVNSIVEGITNIAKYNGTDIRKALTEITPNIKLFVNWASALYEKLVGKIQPAATIMEAIEKVTSPINSLVEGMLKLQDIDLSSIEPSLAAITPSLKLYFSWLDALYSKLGEDKISNAVKTADAIKSTFSPIKTLFDSLNTIYNAQQGKLDGIFAWIKPRVVSIFAWMDRFYNDIKQYINNANSSANAIKTVFSPFKTMFGALDTIYTAQKGKLDGIFAWIKPRVVSIFAWMDRFYNDVEKYIDNAILSANAIKTVFSPFKSLFDTLDIIYSAQKGKLDGIFAWIKPRVVSIFTWMDRLYNDIKDFIKKSEAVAGTIGSVFTNLDKIFKFLDDLKTWKTTSEISDKFDKFNKTWKYIVEEFDKTRIHLGDLDYTSSKLFATYLGEIADNLKKGIDFINELNVYKQSAYIEIKIDEFLSTLNTIIEKINAKADDWSELSSGENSLGEKFGNALKSLFEGLQSAVTFAANFEFTEPSKALWYNFENWVVKSFDEFYLFINNAHTWWSRGPVIEYTEDKLNLVGAWAEALDTLMKSLQSSLDIVKDFSFTPPDSQLWNNFTTWVVKSFDMFYLFVNTAHTWWSRGPIIEYTENELNLVGVWANALDALMNGLQTALTIVKDFNFVQPDQELWNNFTTWVVSTFDSFYVFIEDMQYSEDNINLVNIWSNALNSLMSGLVSATNLVKNFEFAAPDETLWDNFITWVKETFSTIYSWITETTVDQNSGETIPVFDEAGSNLVQAFGDAIGSVMSGLNSALSVSLAIPNTWEPPSEEMWNSFIAWVNDVFLVFYNYVTNPNNFPQTEDSASTFAPVSAFGGAMGNVFSGLKNALTVMDGLSNTVLPTQANIRSFLDRVKQVIDEISTYVSSNFPNTEDSEPMATFASAMNTVFEGLANALSFFGDLGSISGSLRDFLSTARNPDASRDEENDSFAKVMGYVFSAIDGTLKAFKNFVDSSKFEWTQGAQDLFDAVSKVFEFLNNSLKLFADLDSTGVPSTEKIEGFLNAVNQMFSGFVEDFGLMPDDIDNAGRGIYNSLKDWAENWRSLGDNFSTSGEYIATEFINGLVNKISNSQTNLLITNTLNNFSTAFVNKLSGFINYGKDVGSDFISGIITIINNSATMFSTLNKTLSNFVTWFAYSPSGSALNSVVMREHGGNIGKKVMEGFIVGLQSVDIDKPVTGVTDSIKNAIKDAFGIHSPSRVMMEFGKQITNGLSLGIMQNKPALDLAYNALGLQGINTTIDTNTSRQVRFDIYVHGDIDRSTKEELKTFLSEELRRGAW